MILQAPTKWGPNFPIIQVQRISIHNPPDICCEQLLDIL